MRRIATAVAASAMLIAVIAASNATAAGGRPSLSALQALGLVPARAAHVNAAGRLHQLSWHGGPVMHATTIVPVFWGSSWGNASFTGDKVSGLDYLYSQVGGTPYLHTNAEYTDGGGNVNTTSVSKGSDLSDISATPAGAPSTTQVLAEVARVTNNRPVDNAYYPVYSDQRRGNAGYCAWHSSGTISTRVQFGFFFNLDGDPGLRSAGAHQPRPQPGSLGARQRQRARAERDAHRSGPERLVRPAGQREP